MARKFKIQFLTLFFIGIKEPLLKINQRIEKSLQEPVYICCNGLLTLNRSIYEDLKSRQKSWQGSLPNLNMTCLKTFPVLHRQVLGVDTKKSVIITVVVALIVIFCGVFFQMILSQRFDHVEETRRNARFAQVKLVKLLLYYYFSHYTMKIRDFFVR